MSSPDEGGRSVADADAERPSSKIHAVDRAVRRVPMADPAAPAGEVRDSLTGTNFDSAASLVVAEGESLFGLVPLARLLAAPPEQAVGELADRDPPIVGPEATPAQIAAAMHGCEVPSAAVVDDGERFLGLVPPRQLISILSDEHEEDMARLGGYMASTGRARTASEEPVPQRLLHRLPWLLIGLAGAMASALIVGAFEEELQRVVLLAFFIPGVVYMADAVGTQTEALLIRGLAVGVSIRQVASRELLTGLVIGVIIAAAFVPFALLAWGDAEIAIAVALALLASCSIATLVAMLLPWAFQRLGRDPAFGSGPLATVIQDLLSIAVYFAIAIPIAA